MRHFILLTFAMLIFAIPGFAQYPCYSDYELVVYGYSDIAYNDTIPQIVSGLAGTELYVFGYIDPNCEDYDAGVRSSLYRVGGSTLSQGSLSSNGYSIVGTHPIFPALPGSTYCVLSDHGFVYSWSTPWGWSSAVYRLFYTQDCHTFPLPPTPTPTPSPTPCDPLNGLPCQSPTPTPTPTPNVRVTEVGFTNDQLIRKLEGEAYIDEPDGTVATWKRNNNPDHPVAYMKGASPTLFAKFSISPAPTTTQAVKMRIRKGVDPVTSAIDVDLIGGEVRKDGISIPFSNLETGQFIKKSEYEFTWQISFDGGTSWRDLVDGETEHDVHWLNGTPPDEATFRPFKNALGTTYQGLWDEALDWTTGQITTNEADIKKVIQKINSKMAGKISYNPSRPIYNDNPVKILDGENAGQAVCWDNALVLLGLLRSIGIPDVQEKYHWGGDDSTSKRNYYCPPGGCTSPTTNNPIGNRITMQTKRDQLGCIGFPECIGKNPSFAYHATIIQGGSYYDPSYGIVETANLELLTAINVPSSGEPSCVHNAAATALRVSRNAFGADSLALNNNTNRTCSPTMSSLHSGAKLFRFDALGGADTAIFREASGEWITQDEFQTVTVIPNTLGFISAQDVLAPADYDGDGLTDPAIWYANGDFFFLMSSNYYKTSPSYWRLRAADEKAVPGDYDGDKVSDLASWRASDGMWTVRRSSGGADLEVQWGLGSLGDIPVPGDYDGDGKTDFAIWRSTNGEWWVLRSSDLGYGMATFGMAGDIPVQGDYDGDGLTDYAVVRPSDGVWYFLDSENGYQFRSYSGPLLNTNDLPVPADYNSDSKTDVAIWFGSSGRWQIVDSQTGEIRQEFLGKAGNDIPVMSTAVFKQ